MNYFYAAIGLALLIAVGFACRFSYESGLHAQQAVDQAATIKAETVARQAQADADAFHVKQLQQTLADAQASALDRQNRLTALSQANSTLTRRLQDAEKSPDVAAWAAVKLPGPIICLFDGPGCPSDSQSH